MVRQASSEATLPSTWPVGHQFRLKKPRIESTTAIRIPSSTPNNTTPSVVVIASTNAEARTRRNLATAAMSISESAAAITIAARAEFGRFASRSGRKSSMIATNPAPTSPVTWLLAPPCSATAVRDPLVETGNPWKSPAKALAAPIPIISWLASTSSPRLAAKLVEVAMVSASDTRVMPIAAANSAPTSPRATSGNCGRGSPCGSDPTVVTPLSFRSSSATARVERMTVMSTAGMRRVKRGRISRRASEARPTANV